MIDFHTHILPAVDDGAKTEEISAQMLRALQDQGVGEVLLTPHYYAQKRSAEAFLTARNEAFEKICTAVPDGMKIRLGAEVRLTGVNDPSDDALCSLAIEGTKCVLIEFPFLQTWSLHLIERVRSFTTETGYIPVLAHVERYIPILSKPKILQELMEAGCLFQVNTGAFYQKPVQRFALTLLKKDMVHCLGTDAHDLENRAPDYTQAIEAVKSAGLEKEWQHAIARMENLLRGKKIHPTYTPVKKFLGKFY